MHLRFLFSSLLSLLFSSLLINCSTTCSPNRTVTNPIFISSLSSDWYPQDHVELNATLDQYFSEAAQRFGVVTNPNLLQILIAPHAGYRYSGLCAATVYRTLLSKNGDRNRHFTRVIVIAPSHHLSFKGIALPSFSTYRTALGDIPLDKPALKALRRNPSFHQENAVTRVYAQEHSLEVQLPFLQKTIAHFKLIPLIVGEVTPAHLDSIVESLRPLINDRTLIVISTDFVHHGASFGYQKFNTHILDQVRQIDSAVIESIVHQSLQDFNTVMQETGATVCGKEPLKIVLALIKKKVFQPVESRLTCYYTSPQREHDQETVADKDALQSVSYAGIIFTKEKSSTLALCDRLTAYEKKALLTLARRSIENQCMPQKERVADALLLPIKSQALTAQAGAFVTLTKKESGDLRGCIGHITTQEPLMLTVQEMSRAAAFHDSRFSPVTRSELSELAIDISILEPPFVVKDWKKIELGKQGIILEKQRASAVFLPQVATEQGWSLETTLQHLALKAGLSADAWKDPETTFQVFEGCEVKARED